MISLALWFIAGCSIAYLAFQLITFVIDLISFIGECFCDNGGIILWSVIIIGAIIMFFL